MQGHDEFRSSIEFEIFALRIELEPSFGNELAYALYQLIEDHYSDLTLIAQGGLLLDLASLRKRAVFLCDSLNTYAGTTAIH